MKIKSKRMRIFTSKYNYFCKVGGTKVHIFRGDSQISVDDLEFSISIKNFDDLEDIAKIYEVKQEIKFEVIKLMKNGKKQDQAINEVLNKYKDFDVRQEENIITYLIEETNFI
ncbi:MAG: hypothetical protein ACOCV1_06555 [Bacillota bacterium]